MKFSAPLINLRDVRRGSPGAAGEQCSYLVHKLTPKNIPLPPPFRNNGTESFQLWARRYEGIQEARYKDSGVDLDAVLAAE